MDKKVGDVTYSKYLVTLPKEIVHNSKLIGKELKAELSNGKIIIQQS